MDLRHNTELNKILGDGKGNVRAIITKDGEEIPCCVVGITTGVKPQISFLKNSKIETDRGILVNRYLETNIEGVYAIGDCAQQHDQTDDVDDSARHMTLLPCIIPCASCGMACIACPEVRAGAYL